MAKVIFSVDTNEDRCEPFCWALKKIQGIWLSTHFCILFEEEIALRKRCIACLEAEVLGDGDGDGHYVSKLKKEREEK